MIRWSTRWACLCPLLLACGAQGTTTPQPANPAAAPSAAPGQPASEAEPPAEGADAAGRAADAAFFDLHVGDRLTYLVTQADREDARLSYRVQEIADRGDSRAVKLQPVGVLFEDAPVFVGWIGGDASGLWGLDEHVALSQPGFVPLDDRGQLLTEALGNLAWRVPASWLRPAAALEEGALLGWRQVSYDESVAGAVRGEQCVRLERADGELRTTMTICRNVGLVEFQQSGGDIANRWIWRLVDVGVPTEELDPLDE